MLSETQARNRIRSILEDLEAVRENLLALSDDIWLGIDHNDPEALDEGYQFKKSYNEKMRAFDTLATDISGMIQGFTNVKVEPNGTEPEKTDAENARIIKELDKEVPHSIEESFTFKRPYGFVLKGRAFNDMVTWRSLYTTLCKQLASIDLERFKALPDNSSFISNRGRKSFSTNPGDFYVGVLIADSTYTETHFSANECRDVVKRLLDEFGIPHDELRIYLREDRDAEPE